MPPDPRKFRKPIIKVVWNTMGFRNFWGSGGMPPFSKNSWELSFYSIPLKVFLNKRYRCLVSRKIKSRGLGAIWNTKKHRRIFFSRIFPIHVPNFLERERLTRYLAGQNHLCWQSDWLNSVTDLQATSCRALTYWLSWFGNTLKSGFRNSFNTDTLTPTRPLTATSWSQVWGSDWQTEGV